jgi:hypothetical protein
MNMKKNFVFLTILLAAVCLAYPTITLVQENFSGTQFPPPGWAMNNGPYGSWYRSTADNPGNPFARGRIMLPLGPASGYTSLLSPQFTLSEGNTCLVSFLSRRFWDPSAPPSPSGGGWTVALSLDDVDIWSLDLPACPFWDLSPVEIPILVSASTYQFRWCIFAMTDQYIPPRTLDFDVDDVLIRLTAPEVEPVSLGRLKATYR